MGELTKNTVPLQSDVELVFIAPFKCQVGWKEPSYSRSLGRLIYAETGSGTYLINNQFYTVKAGECFWIPFETEVTLLPVEGEPFHIQQFRFRIQDPVLRLKMKNVFPSIKVDHTLESMLIYLMENLANRDAYNRWRVEAFSKAILSLFSLEQPSSEQLASAYITTDGYSPATRRVLHFLENDNHFYRDNSMDEISQALGYNKNYLSAIFSKETGCSIRDYINFHRARVSAIFFFCWELEIADCHQWLHFNSYSHFNRIFKRFVGIAPSSFQKACLSLSAEERAKIDKEEPLLIFHIMPIDDLFAALRHLGQTMAEILEKKAKNSAETETKEM